MANKAKKRRVIDFSTYKFRHIAIKFAYFGWDYGGLAIQKDTNNTVSEHVLLALEKTQLIENREMCGLVCCGRTDKGVSAAGQVISLDVRSLINDGIGFVEGSGPNIASRKTIATQELDYVFLLNKVLPRDIRVLSWAAVPEDFSARFQCKEREYKYIFPRGALNVEAMQEASLRFLGEHDFRNFCKATVDIIHYVRRVVRIEISILQSHHKDRALDLLQLHVCGTAFLYHQIRCMVAVLLLVGSGREEPKIIDELLNHKECPTKPQYQLACDTPLVFYEADFDGLAWQTSPAAQQDLVASLHVSWAQTAIRNAIISMTLEKVVSQCLPSDIPTMHHTDILCGELRARNHRPLMKREREEPVEEKMKRGEEKRQRKALELDSVVDELT